LRAPSRFGLRMAAKEISRALLRVASETRKGYIPFPGESERLTTWCESRHSPWNILHLIIVSALSLLRLSHTTLWTSRHDAGDGDGHPCIAWRASAVPAPNHGGQTRWSQGQLPDSSPTNRPNTLPTIVTVSISKIPSKTVPVHLVDPQPLPVRHLKHLSLFIELLFGILHTA
jgi:hypothetical protein